jgi:hypothetical protein
MWRSKKFLLTALLTVVVLGGIIGGYAVANADDADTSQPPSGTVNLLDRVAEIYEKNTGTAINPDELQKAFTEARDELMTQSRDQMRQRWIDEGKMTQEQLDELDKWLESRPAFPSDEFKDWLESRPDIQLPFGPRSEDGAKPFGGMFRNFRGFAGRFGGGQHGWCAPDTTEE